MIKLFADGADKAGMLEMYQNPRIDGFTTNPTLMRKAGISNYETFAKEILKAIPDKPLSFEVFADDLNEMERQALEIKTWGSNVYVKIPVMNTQRVSTGPVIQRLTQAGVQLNITAILTLEQVHKMADALRGGASAFVSVFAGRIADTGRDPIPLMQSALELLQPNPAAELLWASPREVLNVYQAEAIGCHIITATNDLLKKLSLKDKDLTDYSQETVQMFYNDALDSKFNL